MNLFQYLSPNTTSCIIEGKNYSMSYVDIDRVFCIVPNNISIGYHDV